MGTISVAVPEKAIGCCVRISKGLRRESPVNVAGNRTNSRKLAETRGNSRGKSRVLSSFPAGTRETQGVFGGFPRDTAELAWEPTCFCGPRRKFLELSFCGYPGEVAVDTRL